MHATRHVAVAFCTICFRIFSVDMANEDEDSLETEEDIRNAYLKLCQEEVSKSALVMYKN